MDNLIVVLFLVPLIGFATYGIDCLAERFRGHRLTSEATDTLNDLWSYSENKFFRYILKDKNIKKIEREMKPCIIDIALKLALEDVETKGESSKIFVLIEEEAKIVFKRFKNRNL